MKIKETDITPFNAALDHIVAKNWKGKQGELAKAAGISGGYLSEILGKKKIPSKKVAENLAKACGMPHADFLKYGEELLSGTTIYKKKRHFHRLIQNQVNAVAAFKDVYKKAYPGEEDPPFLDVEKYLPPQKVFNAEDDHRVSAEEFGEIVFSFQDFKKAKEIIECLLTIEFGDPDLYDELHIELREKARLTHKNTIKLLKKVKAQTEDLLNKMMEAYEKSMREKPDTSVSKED